MSFAKSGLREERNSMEDVLPSSPNLKHTFVFTFLISGNFEFVVIYVVYGGINKICVLLGN